MDLTQQQLTNHSRAREAQLAAAQLPVDQDRAIPNVQPVPFGVAKVTSNEGDGEYKITEQWWDGDAGGGEGQWVDAYGGFTNATARERSGKTLGGADDIVLFWRHHAKGNKEQYLIELPVEGFQWAKATGNWKKTGPGQPLPRILCHPCANGDGGGEDTETDITVYLPVSAERDPNVVQGNVIGHMTGPTGWKICVTDYLDSKIGTIRMWYGQIDDIPPGWALCDGTGGTIDLRGRFIVGYESGDDDYGTIGATGGYKLHGDAENDHDDHPWSHLHGLYACEQVLQTGSGDWWYLLYDDDTATAGSGDLTHSETDNRPPYYVLAFIQRIDNSS